MADAEYPGTLAELDRWFFTEEACRKYLVRLRCPGGLRCLRCGSADAWLTERALMHWLRPAGLGERGDHLPRHA